jgi:uncharacterized protein YndB with AHSA1/START domain
MQVKTGRIFETELAIDASPDSIWEALTSGEGVQSWFAPEARVSPGEGGTWWVSWGQGMEGEMRISAWEPGRRFAYMQDREGREPAVVEFTIEGRAGSSLLRLVQSGFGADARFDDEFEATSHAWRLFLHLLKHGLEHPHTVARNVTLFRFIDRPRQELWEGLAGVPAGGVVTFDDGLGYRAIEYPDLNRSVTGVFCEKCGGQTSVTFMSILYDPAPGVEDRIRREWTEVADRLSAGPVSQAHH